jgi:hypothetical protein
MMNYLSNQSLEQEEGIADKLIFSNNFDNNRITTQSNYIAINDFSYI